VPTEASAAASTSRLGVGVSNSASPADPSTTTRYRSLASPSGASTGASEPLLLAVERAQPSRHKRPHVRRSFAPEPPTHAHSCQKPLSPLRETGWERELLPSRWTKAAAPAAAHRASRSAPSARESKGPATLSHHRPFRLGSGPQPRLAILQCSRLVPDERDDVKLFFPYRFVLRRTLRLEVGIDAQSESPRAERRDLVTIGNRKGIAQREAVAARVGNV
jgi:hypothetical protein